MCLITELKRITKEFDLIRPSFLANRKSFLNEKYESTNNGFGYRIDGNYGRCDLMVFDKNRHLFTIMQDSYSPRDRSIMYVQGNILLVSQNPISHVQYRKIFFNNLLTKEKYFNYCMTHDMPSYEHTQLAIKMKYNLQRKHTHYNINIPHIDVNKLKNFTLNVDEFKEKYKNDTPW